MVKFLHTADWHLGMKYSRLGEKAEKARDIRVKSVKTLLDHAREENVDFVLVAGDLFDSNDVDKRLLNTVSEILQHTPVPIYIIPGNHDPLTLDSLYWDPVWETLNNVTIFKESKPFTLPHHNVTIYPSPVSQKQSKKDPTDWIKVNGSPSKIKTNGSETEIKSSETEIKSLESEIKINDSLSNGKYQNARNEISIGLAHGNLAIEGYIDNPNFPINPNRVTISDLDYLALGEWHSFRTFQDSEGINRTIYPGTPETTKFGEENSGKAVIVEIETPHSAPVIQELDVGTLVWEKHKLEINSRADAETLHLNIQQTLNPQNRVLSLNLTGVTDQDTINYLENFPSQFQNKFMHLNIIKDDLFLKPNLLELKALLPEGAVVNQTFEALMALMKTQPEMQEYSDLNPERTREIFSELKGKDVMEGLSPEIINRAFLLMYQMIREAAP
ncbi:exonuclease SbcCD subunit D [Methanobacterium sp.]|uniref:metallophosphoesterase family protein n=1 Tax=Methanobacterium sp. TaxID=2164 RepID=UPI0025D6DA9A|nr:exonuclease SbcCD subunit D [Methanobacterium sp.]MBI5458112.1 exonuclease SbcCD subunit D [Methanobacterium sp.]